MTDPLSEDPNEEVPVAYDVTATVTEHVERFGETVLEPGDRVRIVHTYSLSRGKEANVARQPDGHLIFAVPFDKLRENDG